MSAEFQIAFPCPHLIVEDGVVLGSDRRSLPTHSPVASSGIVRVLANDEFFIPSAGLYSQAQITGAISGPFVIRRCDESLTVTGSAETKTVMLPVGASVDPAKVVAILVNALTTVAVEIDRGHIVLTDLATIGQSSRIFVTGPAAASLGFEQQHGARGAVVYPGWELFDVGPAFGPLATSNTSASRSASALTFKYPRFREPLRQNPRLKVTYVTNSSQCLRCQGTLIENDYRFSIQGDPITIVDENLLYQAALKIILTRVRSNPYHTYYGSALTSRVGAKAIGAVTSLLTEDVQTALSTMQRLQLAQAKYQQVSAKERLYAVTSVHVAPSADDPTAFLVDVVVTNASGTPVAISIVFTVPGVTALTGSNGMSLGLGAVGL